MNNTNEWSIFLEPGVLILLSLAIGTFAIGWRIFVFKGRFRKRSDGYISRVIRVYSGIFIAQVVGLCLYEFAGKQVDLSATAFLSASLVLILNELLLMFFVDPVVGRNR